MAEKLADWLDASGHALKDANGRVNSCDEPGAIQDALKIPRAYLGDESPA